MLTLFAICLLHQFLFNKEMWKIQKTDKNSYYWQRKSSYLLNTFRKLKEILQKDVTYNNIKRCKKPGVKPLFRRCIFGEITGEGSLRKMSQFHLIFWCGNFVERHSFCVVLGELPKITAFYAEGQIDTLSRLRNKWKIDLEHQVVKKPYTSNIPILKYFFFKKNIASFISINQKYFRAKVGNLYSKVFQIGFTF